MSDRTSSNTKRVSFVLGLLLVVIVIEGYFLLKSDNGGFVSDGLVVSTEGWDSGESEDGHFIFKYPASLPTSYLEVVDWPPILNVYPSPLICSEGGSVVERAGKTEKKKMGGREYCVTRIAEGAAGSIYNLYAYAFERNDQVLIFTFSTRSPQCTNYEGFQVDDCLNDQKYNIDRLVSQITGTIKNK